MSAIMQTSPSAGPKRPKGILKNTNSFQQTSPDPRLSPAAEAPPPAAVAEVNGDASARPTMPGREMSEKEIVQMNTEINAGGRRRNTSNPQGALSRRQSSQSNSGAANGDIDESQMRLKWDEANLYLNEGQMGGRMKIDEPKTPFATGYDPADDEEEVAAINAQEINVDELEMGKSKSNGSASRSTRESDIPGLDLGEPELEPQPQESRRVQVGPEHDAPNGDSHSAGHGEDAEENMSHEELEKHRKFEAMRKKHYEMKNVKNLLGHPEDIDMEE